MIKQLSIIWLVVIAMAIPSSAQGDYFQSRDKWLAQSEDAKPGLIFTDVKPVRLVKSVKDDAAFQGWRMAEAGELSAFLDCSFKGQGEVIVDFGEHLTGYLTFSLRLLNNLVADAPVRLRLTFAEVPSELNTPFDPFSGGLSRAWLQDEVITVMSVPADIAVERRMACRHLKIELLGASPGFDFVFHSMSLRAQTSATGKVEPLAETTDPMIRQINKIGLATLKECMQTVYEDGPKRDRRLWIGDLYLEALANAQSFKNHGLTKRCLYMIAAMANRDGLLHATVIEDPHPHPQEGTHTLDYSLIYNVSLLEYLKETGDMETALDLWPVAVRQIEIAMRQFSAEYIYDMDKKPNYWLVFDWKDNYDRQASMQGLTVFALNNSCELAKRLGKEREAKEWSVLAEKLTKAARKHFYDRQQGLVVSGPTRQVSYLSQVWMILSGVLDNKEGARAMTNTMSMPEACYPGSPYAYHYVVEALLECGMTREARGLLTDYWGSMVTKGADTFWEVYDPKNDTVSPYGFFPINSYCHAWSCTPVYFINKYPEIFQVAE